MYINSMAETNKMQIPVLKTCSQEVPRSISVIWDIQDFGSVFCVIRARAFSQLSPKFDAGVSAHLDFSVVIERNDQLKSSSPDIALFQPETNDFMSAMFVYNMDTHISSIQTVLHVFVRLRIHF